MKAYLNEVRFCYPNQTHLSEDRIRYFNEKNI
jgi:hypothetical protein